MHQRKRRDKTITWSSWGWETEREQKWEMFGCLKG
jgi:hypothetical protein